GAAGLELEGLRAEVGVGRFVRHTGRGREVALLQLRLDRVESLFAERVVLVEDRDLLRAHGVEGVLRRQRRFGRVVELDGVDVLLERYGECGRSVRGPQVRGVFR